MAIYNMTIPGMIYRVTMSHKRGGAFHRYPPPYSHVRLSGIDATHKTYEFRIKIW